MFAIDIVSDIRLDRMLAEITYDGQILCQVQVSADDDVYVNFSCPKYVGVTEVEMQFPLVALQRELDSAVRLLKQYR